MAYVTVNAKTIKKLSKMQRQLNLIEGACKMAIKLNSVELFIKFYTEEFKPLVRKYEKVSRCGYIHEEIEEYAAQNNIVTGDY
jgi:hypothetical protein